MVNRFPLIFFEGFCYSSKYCFISFYYEKQVAVGVRTLDASVDFFSSLMPRVCWRLWKSCFYMSAPRKILENYVSNSSAFGLFWEDTGAFSSYRHKRFCFIRKFLIDCRTIVFLSAFPRGGPLGCWEVRTLLNLPRTPSVSYRSLPRPSLPCIWITALYSIALSL